MRGAAASGILAVWKRAAPRNRMREILTSGSVGGAGRAIAGSTRTRPARPDDGLPFSLPCHGLDDMGTSDHCLDDAPIP